MAAKRCPRPMTTAMPMPATTSHTSWKRIRKHVNIFTILPRILPAFPHRVGMGCPPSAAATRSLSPVRLTQGGEGWPMAMGAIMVVRKRNRRTRSSVRPHKSVPAISPSRPRRTGSSGETPVVVPPRAWICSLGTEVGQESLQT
jgi:hypothetical protein